MNSYSIYFLESGIFTGGIVSCDPERLLANVPDACSCILGVYDHLSQRVDLETGAVIDYQPPQPSENHAWNAETRRWEYVPPRAEIELQVWERIKVERERRKAGGVLVGDHWFHSDDASRIQQIGLVMMGAGIPAGLRWKTMTGEFVDMTPELAQQIFSAVAFSDQVIFAVAEKHRAAMMVADDPASYDFSTGWPPIYGE